VSVDQPSVTGSRAEGVRTSVAAFFDRFPRVKPMLVLAVALLVLNVLTLRTVSQVSAIDEREHIDYLLRGSHGRIGQNGDVLTQETLRELCSRGSEIVVWPPCTPGRLDPREFAPRGINVSTQAPFYYLATGLSARALRAATPGWESLVTWGRALGTLWLLVGCYLLLRAGELLRIPPWLVVGALVLVAALPTQLHASTTVNPDATAFVSGAAVLLAVLAWERRGRALWVLGLTAAAAAVFDPTNAVGILVALGYLGLRALGANRGVGPEPRPSVARCSVAAAVIVAGAVVAVAGWEVGSEQLSPPPRQESATPAERRRLDPNRASYPTDGLPVRRILSADSVFGMLPPVVDVAPPAQRLSEPNATWYRLFATAASIAIVGALISLCLRGSLRERQSLLAVSVVVGLIVAGPLFELYRYYVNGFFEPIVPRFGISALPAVVLVLAGLARDRVPMLILSTVAGGLYGTALLTLA
jgi:hypothetical protein